MLTLEQYYENTSKEVLGILRDLSNPHLEPQLVPTLIERLELLQHYFGWLRDCMNGEAKIQ